MSQSLFSSDIYFVLNCKLSSKYCFFPQIFLENDQLFYWLSNIDVDD